MSFLYLLLSIMIWVEKAKDSLILVTSLRKDKMWCRRLRSEFRNNHWYLAICLDCLNALTVIKYETDNVVSDVLGRDHLHAIVEQVDEMLRTTCHTVIKALVKFTHISLTCSKLYTTFQLPLEHFKQYLLMNEQNAMVLTFLGHSV